MTSDAKVGLLLGLVFIFIIAFVINGLPQFHKTEPGAGNVLTIGSSGKNLELGESQKEQSRQFNTERFATSQPTAANQTTAAPVVQTPATSAQTETSQPTQIAANTDNVTRFQIPLPQASATQSVPVETTQNPTQVTIVGPDTKQPQVVLEQTQPVQTLTVDQQQPKVEPVRDPSAKTYTVKKGDSLSKIAQKFYGSDEGLKNSNINRIYEANRITMKSSDQIKIGMELVIPSLPSKTQEDAFPATAFEKVQSISPAVDTVSKTQVQFKEVTVKERDSLWQIAAKNLGDGRRFTEIIKLNSDVLSSTNRLKVGMKLKMPEK